MNPIIAALLLQVVMQLLKNCPEERADNILRMFRDPGPLLRIRLEGAIRRRLNLSPRDWREKSSTIMGPVYAEGRAAALEDVEEILLQAKSA